MTQPHLVIPLESDSLSADRAILNYVRDRLDVPKFIEELCDATPNGLWYLAQALATYIPHEQVAVVTREGEYEFKSPDSAEGEVRP